MAEDISIKFVDKVTSIIIDLRKLINYSKYYICR